MLNVALIVGSTRPNRFADIPAGWIVAGAETRSDFGLDVLDLREHRLPFFNEPAAPIYTEGRYSEPAAEAWRRKIGRYDAFIATVAEYNHGPTAVLKNSFDSAHYEWQHKPIAFVGYGGVGAARAIEQMRGVVIELQMVPIKHEVNIAMEPYLGVVQQGRTLDDYDHLVGARTAMFDDLLWWGEALKAARGRSTSDRAGEEDEAEVEYERTSNA
jgi:NAD(P)H-dependent FMN reductase